MVCFCLLSTFFISFSNVLQCFSQKSCIFIVGHDFCGHYQWGVFSLLKLHFLKGLQWWQAACSGRSLLPLPSRHMSGWDCYSAWKQGLWPCSPGFWSPNLTGWLSLWAASRAVWLTVSSSVTLEDLPSGSQVFGDNSQDTCWTCPETCRGGSVLGVSWSVPIPDWKCCGCCIPYC